jgi:hypothetical protein
MVLMELAWRDILDCLFVDCISSSTYVDDGGGDGRLWILGCLLSRIVDVGGGG